MNFLRRLVRSATAPTITADEVIEQQQADNPYVILDVRNPNEWEAGHIPGAVWIPLRFLAERYEELPKDKPIVCVCHSGSRSAFATELLTSNGYSAWNLIGGMKKWPGEVEK